MILVDSSVWVDHLRHGDKVLVSLLEEQAVLSHPFVVGELALGNLTGRGMVLNALRALPEAEVASDDEVLSFIDRRALFGQGIGYIDAHLLASAVLTPGTSLWTRDRRLAGVAERLSLSARLGR